MALCAGKQVAHIVLRSGEFEHSKNIFGTPVIITQTETVTPGQSSWNVRWTRYADGIGRATTGSGSDRIIIQNGTGGWYIEQTSSVRWGWRVVSSRPNYSGTAWGVGQFQGGYLSIAGVDFISGTYPTTSHRIVVSNVHGSVLMDYTSGEPWTYESKCGCNEGDCMHGVFPESYCCWGCGDGRSALNELIAHASQERSRFA